MDKSGRKSGNIFVVGTDTGVGKTVLSFLLMQFFYGKGYNPFYLKPFQTGCSDAFDEDSDARFIYQHVSELKGRDPSGSVVFCHKNPKAPLFAARDQREKIEIKQVRDVVAKKSLSHDPVIIEGAGGVFVPIDESLLMIDIIMMLYAIPIITARAGLGTINHTLLTVEALESRRIKPYGIVLMDSSEKPTPEDMLRENIEAIEKFSGIKVAGVIGRIKNFSNPGMECNSVIEEVFRSHLTN